MFLKYFYNETLAHASYLVGSPATGQAIVIDPGRDITAYVQAAKAHGLQIVAAAETHIHADFISGARELAEQLGAKLYLSDEGDNFWKYRYLDNYDHQLLKDGAIFYIGALKFEVLHTPGHTPEHISFLVTDTAGANQPIGIFTGDFILVGSAGRPDLLEEAVGIAGATQLSARQMFASLARFKKLPDFLQVWPAHGFGSACGKAVGAMPSSTVGYEKLFNWALQYETETDFVEASLAELPEIPKYFAAMKKLNKEGPPLLKALRQPEQLNLADLRVILAEGVSLIDTRPAAAFAAGHIPGSINLPLNQDFSHWAGWFLDYDRPFYLILEPAALAQVTRDLTQIGLDRLGGYFEPSVIDAWQASGELLQRYSITTPAEIAGKILSGEVTVLDVRSTAEWNEGHLPGARHIPLGDLPDHLNEIPTGQPLVIQCRSGARSAIGASLLQVNGFSQVMNLAGGYRQWVADQLPIVRNGSR